MTFPNFLNIHVRDTFSVSQLQCIRWDASGFLMTSNWRNLRLREMDIMSKINVNNKRVPWHSTQMLWNSFYLFNALTHYNSTLLAQTKFSEKLY